MKIGPFAFWVISPFGVVSSGPTIASSTQVAFQRSRWNCPVKLSMRVWRERCSLPQNESVAARMRREVRRLAASETARKHATQFLWSYIFL